MTAALVFMGETINVKSTTARQTSHIMGFGQSEQVPAK